MVIASFNPFSHGLLNFFCSSFPALFVCGGLDLGKNLHYSISELIGFTTIFVKTPRCRPIITFNDAIFKNVVDFLFYRGIAPRWYLAWLWWGGGFHKRLLNAWQIRIPPINRVIST